MEKITNYVELKRAIEDLKQKQASEWPLLKEQLNKTYESFKPANLIKSTWNDMLSAAALRPNLLKAASSFAVGYVVRKAAAGASVHTFKSLASVLLKLGIGSIISTKSEAIKSAGEELIDRLFEKK